MNFDFHVHTTLSSCSQLALDDIVSQARQRGLDGVCITDHDTMAVRHQIREGIQDNGLCLIFGMEYATRDGDFLLFGPYEELTLGLSAQQLLEHVQHTAGVAVAAHPFRRCRATSEHLIEKELCHIVEGVNGRNSNEENLPVANWQKRYAIKQVGGSDAHTLAELGRVPTQLTKRVTSRDEFVQALRHGNFKPVRLPPQA